MVETTSKTDLLKEGFLIHLLEWEQISQLDISPHLMFQKGEKTIDSMLLFLDSIREEPIEEEVIINELYQYQFISSIELRDFAVLFRDGLLAVVKYDQKSQDNIRTSEEFTAELRKTLITAAQKVRQSLEVHDLSKKEINVYTHQKSPVLAVISHVETIKIQFKKIYRSHDKINEVRLNLEIFKRDFQYQYQKQTNGITELLTAIDKVDSVVKHIYPTADKESIENTIATIAEVNVQLDELQTLETMELISYVKKNDLNIPIDIDHGTLKVKSLDIQSEVSKWFSANVYPHIIELENRRNLSLERSLTAISRLRIKLSALILDDKESYDLTSTDAKSVMTDLQTQYIEPLTKELAENTDKIDIHFNDFLYASRIYDAANLFLPNKGSVQINNISRDAHRRVISAYEKYKEIGYRWIRNGLSRDVELDRTSSNSYVSNKMLFDQNDDRLSLFLKKGYLGKSFIVNRKKLIQPIVKDYMLWLDGFHGAILLYGGVGYGKSALLGMLAQNQLLYNVVNLRAGEPYITKNRSFVSTYDIKTAIQNIALEYTGKKAVLCIDDIELWHDKDHDLYTNISALWQLIHKYRKSIFFVLTCTQHFKDRIYNFKSLDRIFSTELEVGPMSTISIRDAIMMRYKALPELGLTDTEHVNTLGAILRNARGNVGHAMLEYCRFYAKGYDPNLKSQEFLEIIHDHQVLLKYILCHKHLKVYNMRKVLNAVNYEQFIIDTDHLVGHKILSKSRGGTLSINPFLIFSIDNALKF